MTKRETWSEVMRRPLLASSRISLKEGCCGEGDAAAESDGGADVLGGRGKNPGGSTDGRPSSMYRMAAAQTGSCRCSVAQSAWVNFATSMLNCDSASVMWWAADEGGRVVAEANGGVGGAEDGGIVVLLLSTPGEETGLGALTGGVSTAGRGGARGDVLGRCRVVARAGVASRGEMSGLN